MKIGIMGLPQTGKKTLYSLLTGYDISSDTSMKTQNTGIAKVIDLRFNELVDKYNPAKETMARIEVELLPDIDETAIKDGSVFRDIAGTDALCHVVRVFGDETVYHSKGSVDAERDIETINSEIILHDLIFIEKRLERIEHGKKKGKDERALKEEVVLLKMKSHLEDDKPLRTIELKEEEAPLISGYPLITLKEMIIALNVDEAEITNSTLVDKLAVKYHDDKIYIMQISAKLESEISLLETKEERKEFMNEAGIDEPVINLLSQACMESLGLISYFTVGEDEVRQWMVRKGSSAPEAAGVIHSDIQRGFIRAEVMSFNDLHDLGSEDDVKKLGKYHVMGKDYIIRDGDIASFRFNV